MWCEPEPGKSSFNLARVSLSMLEMVSVQILNLQRKGPPRPLEAMEVIYQRSLLPIRYMLLILILFLFLLHQFAGLCIQQRQMGNICPG